MGVRRRHDWFPLRRNDDRRGRGRAGAPSPAEHRGGAGGGGGEPRRCRTGQILPPRYRGLARHRAGFGRGLRRDPSGRNGTDLRPRRSAHEDRDRGHRPPPWSQQLRAAMRRRDLVLLAGAALTAPRMSLAQQAERPRRIGYLTPANGSPGDRLGVTQTRALVAGLRELGWYDGRNITVEHRFSGEGRERIRANAKELVALNPDVIFCVGGPPLAALLPETGTIPIVFVKVNDPGGAGFVSRLAAPGGNATGIAVSEAPIAGKWVQWLKEVAPQITRVLILPEADAAPQRVLAEAVAAAAPSLGLTLVTAWIHEAAA